MPELPEVETIVRGLDRRVTGDAIGSVWIGTKRQPLKSPAGAMVATLEGKQIVRVHRAGKHIVFDLERAVGAGSANGKGTAESSGGPIPAGRFQKNPVGLVNLRPWVYVYKMSATRTPSSNDEISAPVGRTRGPDGTPSRESLE